MTVRRPIARPKAFKPGVLQNAAQGGVDAIRPAADDSTDELGEAVQTGIESIAADFRETLKADASLDSVQREEIARQFEKTLADQAARGIGAPSIPDRREWLATLKALQESGALSESDAAEVVRQLDQALAQFENHEVKVALEFGRRRLADGEQAALEWLKTQQVDQGEAEVASPDVPTSRPATRTETTKSKSRRLRGPPAIG